MQKSASSVCFVVMPFGTKNINGDPNKPYDFEKVYKYIIQRSLNQAELIGIRADERLGSALIHSDMFKDLRDHPIVLADLSLDNPNVYYELGIRHVMSPTGTVLMCRQGTTLPFDIRLSRVIFYHYDGVSLDIGEAEEVIGKLTQALEHARDGKQPDSPVYALLDPVLSPNPLTEVRSEIRVGEEERDVDYQRMIAQQWIEKDVKFDDVLRYAGDVFGCRSVAYYSLERNVPEELEKVASILAHFEQFALSSQLLEQVGTERLSLDGLYALASAHSEAQRTVAATDRAIAIVESAVDRIRMLYPDATSPEALKAMADAHRRLAGHRSWRWQQTGERSDLDAAIEAFGAVIPRLVDVRQRGLWPAPAYVAQAQLRQMLLLRIRDGSVERPDAEGHLDAILSTKTHADDLPDSLSWLRWYQAIALADNRSAEEARKLSITAVKQDAELKRRYVEIGRWQYRNLRRFIDQHRKAWKNASSVALVARDLEYTEAPG